MEGFSGFFQLSLQISVFLSYISYFLAGLFLAGYRLFNSCIPELNLIAVIFFLARNKSFFLKSLQLNFCRSLSF